LLNFVKIVIGWIFKRLWVWAHGFWEQFGHGVKDDFPAHTIGKDLSHLKLGEHKITAGGLDSPFTFKVLNRSTSRGLPARKAGSLQYVCV
jgi:hypothetical protein